MTTVISTPTVSATPTVNLTEQSVDPLTWAGYTTGLIVGVLLLELAFLTVVVCCRRRKIRQEELLKRHIYNTIGGGEQRGKDAEPPSVKLTNYVNIEAEEAHSQTRDIPDASVMVERSGKTATNTAYTGGVHYDVIPGEPSCVGEGEPKPSSSASEHVYSVIPDELTSSKKNAAEAAVLKKQASSGVTSHVEEYLTPSSRNAGNYQNQQVDVASSGFIELKPRDTTAYDTLRRNEQQGAMEISAVTCSGPHNKLLSLCDAPLELSSLKFSPYGQLPNDYAYENEVLPDVEFNPYDDILGMLKEEPPILPPRDDRPPAKESPKKDSRKIQGEPTPHEADNGEDMLHAYDAIDELQKQIHILSQSIPTLDVYGYEDLDNIKPAPKNSRSIPALDTAGYEDLDAAKPQAVSKRQHERDTTSGANSHWAHAPVKGRYSLDASLGMDEEPPLVPPHTIESMYTAVQKKQKSSKVTQNLATDDDERKWRTVPRFAIDGSGPRKSSSISDLLVPPPIIPSRKADMYTAVRKPKKGTTKGAWEISPTSDPYENFLEVPPKGMEHLYTAVQKRPKMQRAMSAGEASQDVPPPLPPKSLEDHYLEAQRKGEVPPIPPRGTMERLFSGVYKHKEEEGTAL